jgi:hypothetical protein
MSTEYPLPSCDGGTLVRDDLSPAAIAHEQHCALCYGRGYMAERAMVLRYLRSEPCRWGGHQTDSGYESCDQWGCVNEGGCQECDQWLLASSIEREMHYV